MKIIIDNRVKASFALTLRQVRLIYRIVKKTIETENIKRQRTDIPKAMEVSLIFVDDAGIQKLNREFRRVDRPTDVLSFPMYEADEPLLPGTTLGDVVISVDAVARQAVEYQHSQTRELCFLFLHGLLHLLGYDHEISETEEKLQFARQDEVLEILGVTR